MTTKSSEPIDLDADELAALASIMATADTGNYEWLKLLQNTLRGL